MWTKYFCCLSVILLVFAEKGIAAVVPLYSVDPNRRTVAFKVKKTGLNFYMLTARGISSSCDQKFVKELAHKFVANSSVCKHWESPSFFEEGDIKSQCFSKSESTFWVTKKYRLSCK